jgi:hypothetical protein
MLLFSLLVNPNLPFELDGAPLLSEEPIVHVVPQVVVGAGPMA